MKWRAVVFVLACCVIVFAGCSRIGCTLIIEHDGGGLYEIVDSECTIQNEDG